MALPNDPIMLLSVINLNLRDFYPTLDALCDDLDEDKAALCAKTLSLRVYNFGMAGIYFGNNHRHIVCMTVRGVI